MANEDMPPPVHRVIEADTGPYFLNQQNDVIRRQLVQVNAGAGYFGPPPIGEVGGPVRVRGTTLRQEPPLTLRAEAAQPLAREEADPASSTSIAATVTLDPLTVEATATVGENRRTVIIRTVLANQVVVQLTALSLLNALELKIETLRAEGRSNSEIAEFDDLKRRVEDFLAANDKRDESPIADTTLSIADALRHLLMHENVRDIGLLGVGLSFCAAAGALGVSDPVILAVSAIAGGKRVPDVLKAAAELVWGKGKDDTKPK